LIFIIVAVGTVFLFANTVFYGRFLMRNLLPTEYNASEATLDAFMITSFSGLMLATIFAADVSLMRVFCDVTLPDVA
jgi:hypothetical protein